MLKEPASSPEFQPSPRQFEDDTPQPKSNDDTLDMRELIEPYLAITHEGHIQIDDLPSEDQAIILRNDSKLLVTFSGYLKQEAELVYAALDKALEPHNRFLLLRENQGNPEAPHIIHIIEGRLEKPQAGSSWLNIVLFILTIFSVMYTGAIISISHIKLVDPVAAEAMSDSIFSVMRELWRGLPYAASILAILVPHEMGHYFIMRRHNLQASLPYFIPAWLISPFGTFGAAIMLRETPQNRKILLDIGAAGPIAGFIVAVPLVIYGLSTSTVVPFDTLSETLIIEGNSLIYAFAKIVALGELYPNAEADVLINQVAFAGWTGLFVTALNMIPLGQLDGGHVMYALFGNRARLAYYPVLLGLIALSLIWGQLTWVFFLIVLFLIGRFYAVPLDAITPLDNKRRIVAFIALAIFILTFTPIPVYEWHPSNVDTDMAMALQWSMMLVVGLCTVPRWWQLRSLSKAKKSTT